MSTWRRRYTTIEFTTAGAERPTRASAEAKRKVDMNRIRKSRFRLLAWPWQATAASLVAATVLSAAYVCRANTDAKGNAPATSPQHEAEAPVDSDHESAEQGIRRREGATIAKQLGYFEAVGDRWVFRALDDSTRLVSLENLALERVARAVAEHTGRLRWSISGTLTEYRGANYLLITRAVLSGNAPTPASDRQASAAR